MELNKNINEMTGKELRELALASSDETIHEKLDEEAYSSIIDFELSLQNPDSQIMAFCYKGLCKYELYNDNSKKLELGELMKKAGVIKKADPLENAKTFSILDFKRRSFMQANRENKNSRILRDNLKDKLQDTYEKEGITFIISRSTKGYDLTWLNNDLMYTISNRLSLDDVNDFISSYAA